MTSDAWIAVSDALPTEGGSYLVYAPCMEDEDLLMLVAGFDPASGWLISDEGFIESITHWQHLPEPPRA